jgi:hypothetical protein
MKDRFRAARALFSQPQPASVTHSRRAVAAQAIGDEIDIGVNVIGRHVARLCLSNKNDNSAADMKGPAASRAPVLFSVATDHTVVPRSSMQIH